MSRRFPHLNDAYLDRLSDEYEELERERQRIVIAKEKIVDAYHVAAQGRTFASASFAPWNFAARSSLPSTPAPPQEQSHE